MNIRCYARKELINALRRYPPLLEVSETAVLSGVTPRTVRRWIQDGNLAAVDKGLKGTLVPKSALINFMCGEARDGKDNDEAE